jgi:G3E family GTPase
MASVFAFAVDYGPFKIRRNDAIEDVLVLFNHSPQQDERRHPMRDLADEAQAILLHSLEAEADQNQREFTTILVVDVRSMFGNTEELAQAMQKEAQDTQLTKRLGKSLLRLLLRLRLRNSLFAAYGEACPLLLKLLQVLDRVDPHICSSIWLLHPVLPAKFINTQLIQAGGLERNDRVKVNLTFENESAKHKRHEILRCQYHSGSTKVWKPLETCLLASLFELQDIPTSTLSSFDTEHLTHTGKSFFLSKVTVEMSPYTKQYERNAVDVTSELTTVNNSSTGNNDISKVNWSTCQTQVGGLVLRGNRCILVRSLEGAWEGMKIPSVVLQDGESHEDAAIRSITQLCEVDGPDEVMALSHIPPVALYGTIGGRAIVVLLYPLYAKEPPPDGPLEDADMEDDETPYDWYTFSNASKKLDERSMAALQTMASALLEAATVGLLPCKWGGVFGQEAKMEGKVCAGRERALKAYVEEWNPSRQADVLQDVRKAKKALLADLSVPRNDKLPVTVLSGFLGSGKTSLMTHILTNYQGMRVAILVNDMAEVNIDAALIKQAVSIHQREEHMVELSNGCICCTLREDLLAEVASIALQGCFDYLLIESSGVSEPMAVAETFSFEDTTGLRLDDIACIDTMTTVVDGSRFLSELQSLEMLRERDWHSDAQDERTISHLLCDQIEFANVIVLNKCDLMNKDEKKKVKKLLHEMNPTARVVESVFSAVPLDAVMGTKLFSMSEAEKHDGWLKEARIGEHTPETEEYGISSFTFRSLRPFHPGRLHGSFEDIVAQKAPYRNLLRAKGFVWLANHPQVQGEYSFAGKHYSIIPGNPWWAEIDKADWPANLETDIAPLWHEPFGDRQQEIVIIGQNLDKDAVTKALEQCLLSSKEMMLGQEAWYKLCTPDPFETEWKTSKQFE